MAPRKSPQLDTRESRDVARKIDSGMHQSPQGNNREVRKIEPRDFVGFVGRPSPGNEAPWCVHSSRSQARQFAEHLLSSQAAPSNTRSPKFQTREERDYTPATTRSPKLQMQEPYEGDRYQHRSQKVRSDNRDACTALIKQALQMHF